MNPMIGGLRNIISFNEYQDKTSTYLMTRRVTAASTDPFTKGELSPNSWKMSILLKKNKEVKLMMTRTAEKMLNSLFVRMLSL